jgi:arylsulfatase A-like enzyme
MGAGSSPCSGGRFFVSVLVFIDTVIYTLFRIVQSNDYSVYRPLSDAAEPGLNHAQSAAAPHSDLFWRVGKRNALRHGDWKLIRDGSAWQLFDLTADIAETADLAAKEPERVAELAALWDMRNAEQSEPLWK